MRDRQIVSNDDTVMFETETVSLDEFCKGVSVDRIHHLKIDVQGARPSVAGSQKLLAKQRINIIEVELIVGQAYEEQRSFLDLEKYQLKTNTG